MYYFFSFWLWLLFVIGLFILKLGLSVCDCSFHSSATSNQTGLSYTTTVFNKQTREKYFFFSSYLHKASDEPTTVLLERPAIFPRHPEAVASIIVLLATGKRKEILHYRTSY